MDEEMWKQFMTDGDGYLRTAVGGRRRPKVFTPGILYNVMGMAIEKHIMAALLFHGRMADNHTLIDLVEAAKQVGSLEPDISNKLIDFQSYQDLCSLQTGPDGTEFPAERVAEMLEVAQAVQQWAKASVGEANAEAQS